MVYKKKKTIEWIFILQTAKANVLKLHVYNAETQMGGESVAKKQQPSSQTVS